RRSRMPASTTRPPSQNAAAARWRVPTATDTAGAGVVTGWPATGHVPRPTAPSTASVARSPRVARPAVTRRSSHTAAASTPSRTRWARPYVVASTSPTAAAETSVTGPPVVYGTCSQTPATVLAATSPAPVHSRRVAPFRDSRWGHSRASATAAPIRSTRPAYPTYRAALSARLSGSPSAV